MKIIFFKQPEKYQPVAQRILSRFGNEASSSVPIKKISIPDLSVPLQLSRHDAFSVFLPSHQKMAAHLTTLFLGKKKLTYFYFYK